MKKKWIIQVIIGLVCIGVLIYVVMSRQSESTKTESQSNQYNNFTIPAK